MATRTSAIQKMIFELQKDPDQDSIHAMLRSLDIPESEWTKYAFMNDSPRGHTRNLIFDCEKFCLILICWQPGKGSKRHDHNVSDCYFKVLRGKIHETQSAKNDLPKSEKTYNLGEVCHIEKLLKTTHKMKNCDPENIAVTLHLYIPPLKECKYYGKKQTEEMKTLTFDSRFGYATDEGTTLLGNL